MNYNDIIYEKQDNVARIILNRPQVMNAVRPQTVEEILSALEHTEKDREIGVLVLTGAGGKAFCSGGDIRWLKDSSSDSSQDQARISLKIAYTMRNMGKPIIAAVDGYAVGFGYELLMFCDLVIATKGSKMGVTEVKVGSSPMFGATQWTIRMIGERRARELVFMARLIDAQEAYRIGLINKAVPKGKLPEELDIWCKKLLGMSPQSLKLAKTSMNFESDLLYSSITHGVRLWTFLHGSDEWKEGMNAFIEKREPDFSRFRR
ncbi:MAG: enoyl-CoA hydratase-related protein [Thermodesulfobacteriota bacterium]|nr:enoyl-CoA hydratase-related protein [Thermodesulfobacteriota bacterium]